MISLLFLQIILNILMGNPYEKQLKIRENIRLLNEHPEFNSILERYGRSVLLKFRVRKHISKYDAQTLIHNPIQLKKFCNELEDIIKK
ncbi:hypothetical protein CG478_018080 [Bacillus cytotoxicus]|nr:hypothetical protein CG483_018080 [Bacillus cytotoxicus]AWC42203.1 hypothetical protein CG480_018080 [Bacillus cytotoxicus]AWC50134.1 hypothetical protein CG478_018080 [Bacillus cytotoxicus]AWC54191.1 hypothetical protein CG477_018280 [Bacillus cytotoxicus]AWC58316.1 hypothetical protein CG476_018305 [Bacillus cytotoxicus]